MAKQQSNKANMEIDERITSTCKEFNNKIKEKK